MHTVYHFTSHSIYYTTGTSAECREEDHCTKYWTPLYFACIIIYDIKYLILFLPPVPQPGVAITLSHTPPLYAGTSLTLTCTVTLDPSVNNNERVVTEWKGPRQIAGDRYSVTSAMREPDSRYSTSLVISPLTDQDDGMYTCTVRVSGGTNHQVVTTVDAVIITVMGKYISYANVYNPIVKFLQQLYKLQW